MKNRLIFITLFAIALATSNAFSMQLPEGVTEVARIQQSDGKTLILAKRRYAGQDTNIVYRYNTNDQLDNSFGMGGMVGIFPYAATPLSIDLQPFDQKILVKTLSDEGQVTTRFNQNGTIDWSFGEGGREVAPIKG